MTDLLFFYCGKEQDTQDMCAMLVGDALFLQKYEKRGKMRINPVDNEFQSRYNTQCK